jgi:hypothetical protein
MTTVLDIVHRIYFVIRTKFPKLDLLPHQLGPLERASLDHQTVEFSRLALPTMGPN